MEQSFKALLKYLKEHESQLSMFLGVLVVIVSGVLLVNVFKGGANGQGLTSAEPTITVETTMNMETTDEELPSELEAEGIEQILAEDAMETTPTTGPSVLERAGKALLGILGIRQIEESVGEDAADTSDEPGELAELEDGTLMPQNLPQTYTVKAGDHLWAIAERFYQSGYNWVDIAAANQLTDSDQLEVGQELQLPQVRVRVPVEGLKGTTVSKTTPVSATQITDRTYIVVKGDTLWSIAVRAYGDGFQWTKIVTANPTIIKDAGLIEPGWELQLPDVS